jgi:hypothetical protein
MGVHRKDELIAKTEGGGTPEPPQRQPQPDDKKPNDQTPDSKRPGDNDHERVPDGKDEPGKDGKPRRQPFRLPQATPKKEAMPEVVKQHFEKGDPGFVNYFFNRQNQDRLWHGLLSHGDFSQLNGVWTLAGMVTGNVGEFRISLTDTGAAIALPTGDTEIKLSEGLGVRLNPPGSGGMLAALTLWRKYLVEGPQRFGKVEYRGTAPLPMREGLFDVLVGTSEGVECLFYFEPASGQLAALEMYPDGSNTDPCEIYFLEYREQDGRSLPLRMEVRYGDVIFGVFEITKLELEKTGATP